MLITLKIESSDINLDVYETTIFNFLPKALCAEWKVLVAAKLSKILMISWHA